MIRRAHQSRGTFQTLAKDLDVANAYALSVNEVPSVGLAAAKVFHHGLDAGLGGLDVPALVRVDLGQD
jgi:hypothetical protein